MEWVEGLGDLRNAVGLRSVIQSFDAGFPSFLRTVDLVSQAPPQRAILRRGGAGVGCLLACLTPWLARNYRVFGKFVFIRDDFGLQFRLGN